jgi:hypothetical protein
MVMRLYMKPDPGMYMPVLVDAFGSVEYHPKHHKLKGWQKAKKHR